MTDRAPLQAGEPAPDFSLPAVHQDGKVSLGDYRGKSPVLIAIFRGLYCPFCRRGIAQLSAMSDKLRAAGVEPLAVVATETDNARMYFKHRPVKLSIAADAECATHKAFGLPAPVPDENMMKAVMETRINPTGELPEPMNPMAAAHTLNERPDYKLTSTDESENHKQGFQLKGQFLLDREGVVRWANVECAQDGLAGFGKFPSEGDLMAAVQRLN